MHWERTEALAYLKTKLVAYFKATIISGRISNISRRFLLRVRHISPANMTSRITGVYTKSQRAGSCLNLSGLRQKKIVVLFDTIIAGALIQQSVPVIKQLFHWWSAILLCHIRLRWWWCRTRQWSIQIGATEATGG